MALRHPMDDELTPEQKFSAESPEKMVPRALLQGRNREDLVTELVRLDWPPKAAQALVERVARDIERYRASPGSRAELVRECRRQFVGGLLLAILGLVASGWSAFVALLGFSPVWILFFGLILGGFVLAARGFSRWRLYRRDVLFPGSHD